MTAVPADLEDAPRAPGCIAERLRTISSERADASTRLLGAGDRLLREDGTARLELRADVAQQPVPATTAVLTHAHGRILLTLSAERGSAAIGDRTWHDFAGDARLLAWAVAYDALVERLAGTLGLPLLPVELLAEPPAAADVWHWVGFRFDRGEGGCEGRLGLDRAAIEALIAADGWRRDEDGTRARIERGEVPLHCRLRLPPLQLSAGELRALQVGDVVLLGTRESVASSLRLQVDSGDAATDARYAWAARAAADGVEITRALTPADLRIEATMTPPPPDTSTDPRDAIPVRIELLLDALDVDFAALERIKAGQILPLRQPVESAQVTLRVNGAVVGNGELVALGELLGVKVTRIGDERGSQ
ncbi:MAG TPA: FliM/FliN family flagellar motor switch protein [Dokdonella sp.]